MQYYCYYGCMMIFFLNHYVRTFMHHSDVIQLGNVLSYYLIPWGYVFSNGDIHKESLVSVLTGNQLATHWNFWNSMNYMMIVDYSSIINPSVTLNEGPLNLKAATIRLTALISPCSPSAGLQSVDIVILSIINSLCSSLILLCKSTLDVSVIGDKPVEWLGRSLQI